MKKFVHAWSRWVGALSGLPMFSIYFLFEVSYHDRSVSNGVFWDDHAVAVLLPLRRLVLYVGDGDRKLHSAAPVAPVCSHYLPSDKSSLLGTGAQKREMEYERERDREGEGRER